MDPSTLHIDADIARARTLPAAAYFDPAWYASMRERVFAWSWQLLPDLPRPPDADGAVPATLLPGCLDVPVVITRHGDAVRCLSNVCTHRGNLVATAPHGGHALVCRYHGRRFGLDGRCVAMPGFEGEDAVPLDTDHLPLLRAGTWRDFLFVGLSPQAELHALLEPVAARVGWLPLEHLQPAPERARDYLLEANWALYVDNYLEGFHIPFVHTQSLRGLDAGAYRCETLAHGGVQIGIAHDPADAFELPAGAPDAGGNVAAYYFWLFPNLMLNFYPWGLSVNVVQPLGPERTRIAFRSFVGDPARLERGAGADLDRVEEEDEAIVRNVQAGVRSPCYERGRYAPAHEKLVHHFHRLLAAALNPDA